NFNPIIAVLSATHPLAWSFFFLNMAELIPLAFLFRAHLQRNPDIGFVPFLIYIGAADLFVNIVQALGLYVVVLKLGLGQVVVLFFWQWLMAVIIGGPMGCAFYRAVGRAGGFLWGWECGPVDRLGGGRR